MTWRATILTLFPEMFPGPLGASLTGKGLSELAWSLETIQIRDFGRGVHRAVDDTPAGGGPGMVLRADVIGAAIDRAQEYNPGIRTLYLSPRGRVFDQAMAHELALEPGLILLCGRFEGVDQRAIDGRALEEVSIGDYVLSGGELAAMVMLDAIVRLLPGVLGAAASLEEESFESGLLEYPQFTRPREWEGRSIPEILLSGDHKRIAAWRREQALELTRLRRPDLLLPASQNPAALHKRPAGED